MKAYLDLLPGTRKKDILREKRTRSIIGEGISFLFPVIVLGVMLVTVQQLLDIRLDAAESLNLRQSQRKEIVELKKYEQKFSETNSRTESLVKLQDFHLAWSNIILKLSALFPEDVYLTSLSSREFKLFLSGRARYRDSLTDLKEALKNSECFANANLPPSYLVVNENVDFQMDVDVNRECLRE